MSMQIQIAPSVSAKNFVPRRTIRMRGAPLKYVKDHHAYFSDLAYTRENLIYTLIILNGLIESIAL